jgi:UDP-2,3-diacylglucosamine pyrophosphatase LpxH
MREEGSSWAEIFASLPELQKVYKNEESLSRQGRRWKHKMLDDQELLDGANLGYEFLPYATSVHVDGNGKVISAWVKQAAASDAEAWERFLSVVSESKVVPIRASECAKEASEGMLEIPLFDMHFGIADLSYYRETMMRLLSIIREKRYHTILLAVGQDLLHNDDFRGRTTKGTMIQKVDMAVAWSDAETFFVNLIAAAQESADYVEVIYSHGNHDESMSWAFVKLLERVFPDVRFDTQLLPRKSRLWQRCFVGWTHGEYAKSRPEDLFAQFALENPKEFAESEVREIHTGHLHREGGRDYGMMVRRLSTGAKTDDWSRDEGFVGAHKRFMIFAYEPSRLAAIHYV